MTVIAALVLVVTYEMPVNPERLDEFLVWIESGIEASRNAPGNLQFDVLVELDGSGRVLFVERWASAEAQNEYLRWRRENGELERMASFLSGPPVKRTWRPALQLDGRVSSCSAGAP